VSSANLEDSDRRIRRISEQQIYWVLGLPFDCVDLKASVARIRDAVKLNERLVFATPNLNFLRISRNDSKHREDILRTDFSIADGMPLVWLGRLLGVPFPERVAGSSLMQSIACDQTADPLKVFFFGGPPNAAQTASENVNRSYSGIRAVGSMNPGFGSLEEMSSPDVCNAINASEADFLCVALGARKGHAWIERNRSQLRVPLISHLGAVVNFFAGTVKRAPQWMQTTGLEWLWRLVFEPRLIRRYSADALFLARDAFARVLPLMFLNWRESKSNSALTVETRSRDAHTVAIHITGSLTRSNLHSLQQVVLRYSKTSKLLVYLTSVSFIDARGLGYLYSMRFRGHCDISFIGTNPRLNRLLKLHSAEVLIS